jgi:hypothetical protein
MDRVGDLLDPTLKAMGVRGRVREAQIESALALLLGDSLSPLCHAVELKRGTLQLATANTALAHQLQVDSARLIHSLNDALGTPAIRRLRFTGLSRDGR